MVEARLSLAKRALLLQVSAWTVFGFLHPGYKHPDLTFELQVTCAPDMLFMCSLGEGGSGSQPGAHE